MSAPPTTGAQIPNKVCARVCISTIQYIYTCKDILFSNPLSQMYMINLRLSATYEYYIKICEIVGLSLFKITVEPTK